MGVAVRGSQSVGVAMCGRHGVPVLQHADVAARGKRNVGECWCMVVVMQRSCIVGQPRFVGGQGCYKTLNQCVFGIFHNISRFQ